MPRKHFLLSTLFLLLLLVGLPAWLTYRAVRQERLNRALITAIKKNDTKTVMMLLDQGADANAQDEQGDPRPFWRIWLDSFSVRSHYRSQSSTVLLTALRVVQIE